MSSVYIISDHYLGSMFDLKEGVVEDKGLAKVAPVLPSITGGVLSGLSRVEVWPVTSDQFHLQLLLVQVHKSTALLVNPKKNFQNLRHDKEKHHCLLSLNQACKKSSKY